MYKYGIHLTIVRLHTGNQLAVGSSSGRVVLWDAVKGCQLTEMGKHAARVGSLAWGPDLLASGSRDKQIFLQDVRVRSFSGDRSSFSGGSSRVSDMSFSGSEFSSGSTSSSDMGTDPCVVRVLTAHKQEVCGLKWSPDFRQLASGGNDNKLFVWNTLLASSEPVCTFSDHCAAVKAIAWSPHQSGLLASGGGTADRHIRFWNSFTGTALHRVDTGSQVTMHLHVI